MKWLKTCFHFLGGITFAIFLIGLTAFLVILGTFLESTTDSHLYAAQWTYQHPLFIFLLWMFFINILFAALRRWPFKLKHIPFLITHLGLLMILGGTIVKNRIGLQGNLTVFEGSGNQHVLVPHTHAIQIRKRDASLEIPIEVEKIRKTYTHPEIEDFSIKVLGYCPHVSEKMETWIKGEWAFIAGFAPFKVSKETIDGLEEMNFDGIKCDVAAVKTTHLQETIQDAYLHRLSLQLTSKIDPKYNQKLELQKDMLKLSYDKITGFESPQIEIKDIVIPLQGNQALYNLAKTPTSSFFFDLKREKPLLIFVEDDQQDLFLFAFDQYGRVHAESSQLKSLIVYDQGFSGYAAQAKIPFSLIPRGRIDKEKNDQEHLSLEIRQAMTRASSLSPPLALFKQACEKVQVDFVDTFVQYLSLWNQSDRVLFSPHVALADSLMAVLENIQWNETQKKACVWIVKLFDQIPMESNNRILDYLQEHKWPLMEELRTSHEDLLTTLSQQLFSIVSQLPDEPSIEASQSALFSAFLKAYGIEYKTIRSMTELEIEPFVIETPITMEYQPEKAPVKLEDLHQCLLVEVREGREREKIALAYQTADTGLRWPVLGGKYILRFQPHGVEIPYRVRLRQARQIYYPNTQQPYSYESDILISEIGGEAVEKTLSMNQVHETWDGYRFYLAGMSSTGEQGIKRVQIVVNHDPAKYWLTYPGAFILFIGIILLFWLRKNPLA